VDKKMLQTQFSVRATDLAETFRATVGRMRVGPHGYIPDLTAPEGPSTGGGVQAMQHLRLTAPQPSMPSLVVGHVNQRDGTAELRTLHYVDTMCRERFKQGAPLDPGQYSAFVEAAKAFLGACGLRVSLASPPAELAERLESGSSIAPPKNSGTTALVVTLVLILLGGLGGVVYWLFLRK
jgi:hypothetical protein